MGFYQYLSDTQRYTYELSSASAGSFTTHDIPTDMFDSLCGRGHIYRPHGRARFGDSRDHIMDYQPFTINGKTTFSNRIHADDPAGGYPYGSGVEPSIKVTPFVKFTADTYPYVCNSWSNIHAYNFIRNTTPVKSHIIAQPAPQALPQRKTLLPRLFVPTLS